MQGSSFLDCADVGGDAVEIEDDQRVGVKNGAMSCLHLKGGDGGVWDEAAENTEESGFVESFWGGVDDGVHGVIIYEVVVRVGVCAALGV